MGCRYGHRRDPGGNGYITGSTGSTDFPTADAVQPYNAYTLDPSNSWRHDAFITKLTPAGSAIYSTYLGGSGLELDWTGGIAADASGNAYVTGSTIPAIFQPSTRFKRLETQLQRLRRQNCRPAHAAERRPERDYGERWSGVSRARCERAREWPGLGRAVPALASSATSNRLAYQYLNGQGTAPLSGQTGATLTFACPAPATTSCGSSSITRSP